MDTKLTQLQYLVIYEKQNVNNNIIENDYNIFSTTPNNKRLRGEYNDKRLNEANNNHNNHDDRQ